MYIYIYIYHIFFIHSSVDEHLDCFCVQAFVNSAAVNTDACIFLSYSFFHLYAQKWDCWVIQ